MSALSLFFGKLLEKTTRKRGENAALYPDASKAIEEFHLRLAERIAAERARSHASQRREQAASG